MHKKDGSVMVAIRDHDIIAYMPYSELGYGVLAATNYPHVARLRPGVDDLEKAFRKALRSKLTNSEWAKHCSFTPRKVKATESLKDKVVRLERERKAAETQLKKLEAAKPEKKAAKKVPKKTNKVIEAAIANVAETA